MLNFAKVAFKAPKFSSFEVGFPVSGTVDFGDLFPIEWEILRPGERIKRHLSHLTRLDTMLSPVMSGFDLTIDAFAVPFRLILKREPAEQYLNLSGSSQFSSLGNGLNLIDILRCNKKGSLLDYLNYPTFPNVSKWIQKFVSSYKTSQSFNSSTVVLHYGENELNIGQSVTGSFFGTRYISRDGTISISYLEGNFLEWFGLGSLFRLSGSDYRYDQCFYTGGIRFSFGNSGVSLFFDEASEHDVPFGFMTWLLSKTGSKFVPTESGSYSWSYESLLSIAELSPEQAFADYCSYLRDFLIKMKTVVEYTEGTPVYGDFPVNLFRYSLENSESLTADDLYKNSLPLATYWRIVSDWYYNYNSGPLHKFELFDLFEYSFGSAGFMALPEDIVSPPLDEDYPDLINSWRCFKRNWKNDYFTSCLQTPTSTGSDMRIPVNGTIPELREANIWQKMYERAASAGRKYRDNIRAFFNITPDATTLDVAQVLCRDVRPLSIQTVDQTSQADLDKMLRTPLGSMAGQSTTYDKDVNLFDYTADEDCIVMILGSYRPITQYMQGCDRRFSYRDRLDYLWPELAAIGDQSVKTSELFCDMDMMAPSNIRLGSTFGWQRRYGELMYREGSVHGDFIDSLDYWNTARHFDTTPSLDPFFTEINAKRDHLDRIFAYSASPRPIKYFFYVQGATARPLPRYINYDL